MKARRTIIRYLIYCEYVIILSIFLFWSSVYNKHCYSCFNTILHVYTFINMFLSTVENFYKAFLYQPNWSFVILLFYPHYSISNLLLPHMSQMWGITESHADLVQCLAPNLMEIISQSHAPTMHRTMSVYSRHCQFSPDIVSFLPTLLVYSWHCQFTPDIVSFLLTLSVFSWHCQFSPDVVSFLQTLSVFSRHCQFSLNIVSFL